MDDEEFFIKINFDLFAVPEVNMKMDLSEIKNAAEAWTIEVEKDAEKEKQTEKKKVRIYLTISNTKFQGKT